MRLKEIKHEVVIFDSIREEIPEQDNPELISISEYGYQKFYLCYQSHAYRDLYTITLADNSGNSKLIAINAEKNNISQLIRKTNIEI